MCSSSIEKFITNFAHPVPQPKILSKSHPYQSPQRHTIKIAIKKRSAFLFWFQVFFYPLPGSTTCLGAKSS